jgi:hypothetical protein
MMMTENMVFIRNVDGSTSVHSAMEALATLQSELDAARAEVAALREEAAHAWAVANGEARR